MYHILSSKTCNCSKIQTGRLDILKSLNWKNVLHSLSEAKEMNKIIVKLRKTNIVCADQFPSSTFFKLLWYVKSAYGKFIQVHCTDTMKCYIFLFINYFLLLSKDWFSVYIDPFALSGKLQTSLNELISAGILSHNYIG